MTHLLTWSIQVSGLVAAGALAACTLASAKARLIFWQGLLLALLLLPAIEPWQSRPIPTEKLVPITAAVFPEARVVAQPGFMWRAEYWLWVLAAGALLRIAWIAAGFLRLRRYRQKAVPLPKPPFRFDFTSARWYMSDAVPGPATYGWRVPSILLPARIMRLPASLREAIACHELIHVHRGDWLFVLAEEIVRSLFWFHPAVWYALSRIQLAREQVVDREVVCVTENRDSYLDALVEVAAHSLHPDLAPASLFLRKRHLAARVAAVLKEVSMSKPRIAARLAAVCSAMFLAACIAVWFAPFVSFAQTVLDDPGVTVDAGATLLHRAPVHHPAGANGVVILEASLNTQGEVIDAHVLSGPDDLRKEALSSVLQWHYSPGMSRVQISIRFDPASSSPQSMLTPPPPPPPPPPPGAAVRSGRGGAPVPPSQLQDARLTRIEFTGFSPEGERELRNRLPLREGDTITSADGPRVSAAVSEFDSHASVTFSRATNGGVSEMVLRIRVSPQTGSPTFVPRIGSQFETTGGGGGGGGASVRIGPGITPPIPIYSPEPDYSAEASKAKYQGTVRLTLVVDQSGRPTQIKVIGSLGLGLDEKAIEAVEQWRFKPGMKDGQPVAVQATLEVNFRLLNNPPQQ